MSIYIMTVGELAKKRGEPVGEFVKKVQDLGFDAGSHAKKLTQADLDLIIAGLDGSLGSNTNQETKAKVEKAAQNPNVIMIKMPNNKISVALVDATLNEVGNIDVRIVTQTTEDSIGEALLEFRKQMGLHMGVN